MIKKFQKIASQIIGVGLLASALVSCSGGTTAGGLGLSIGGSWQGVLFQGNSSIATFTMGLSQSSNDEIDPFAGRSLIGSLSTSDICLSGGTIEGTLSGNNLNITVKTPNGKLTLTGLTNNNSMTGSWVNAGEFVTITGQDTVVTTDDSTITTTCNIGGRWNANR